MADKLKLEAFILVFAVITGVFCEKLVATAIPTATLLYGGLAIITFSLTVIAIVTSISIHGDSDKKETKKDGKIFYGLMGLVAIMTMLILLVLDINHTVLILVSGLLWYLANAIRTATLWDWF